MDKYTIISRIGEGAHGVVLKGRHKDVGFIYLNKLFVLDWGVGSSQKGRIKET